MTRRSVLASCVPLAALAFAACSSSNQAPSSDGGAPEAGAPRDAAPSNDAPGASDASPGSCTIPDAGVAPGTGTMAGALADEPLPTVVETTATIDASKLVLRFTDHAGACGASENALTLPGSKVVSLEILDQSYAGTTPPFTAGTYVSDGLLPVDAGTYDYSLSVARTDLGAACAVDENVTASVGSGSIVITSLTATRVTGTYDLVLGPDAQLDGSTGNDHISGAFDAPICNPLAGSVPACCGAAESDDSGVPLDAKAPPQGDDAGPPGDQSANCSPGVLTVLPEYYSVSPFASWTQDATGMVFTQVLDARQSPPANAPPAQIMGYAGGTLSTLFTATGSNEITSAVPDPVDGKTIYFAMGGLQQGLYSIPRAGAATATEIYTPATGADVYGGFAVDDTSIYFATRDGSILSMPKGGGTTKPVYTAPAGQTITNLVWDLDELSGNLTNGTGLNTTANALYWTETATVGASSPTVIRSVRVSGGVLAGDAGASTLVATLPSSITLTQMLPAWAGTVFFVQSGVADEDGSFDVLAGLYSVAPGGSPQLLDANGSVPIQIDNTGKYAFYGSSGGLGRVLLSGEAGYPQAPSVVLAGASIDALGFSNVFGSADFYSVQRCIYAPQSGWD